MSSSLSNGNVTIGGNADFSTTGSYPWWSNVKITFTLSGATPTSYTITNSINSNERQTFTGANSLTSPHTISHSAPAMPTLGNQWSWVGDPHSYTYRAFMTVSNAVGTSSPQITLHKLHPPSFAMCALS
jgi:hypothetical protein